MNIIAIDPGYERLGIAVIEKKNKNSKEVLVYSECFKTPKDIPHEQRLCNLGKRIREIIKIYHPTHLAIEDLYINTNQKTAMLVAEAKGVIMYEASLAHIPTTHFSPPQIKLAVCGNGKADKTAIIKMVPLLITIAKTITYDDEFDAVAVGLTFFAHFRDFPLGD